mmetsp:Transcript_8413/g.24818  ORF Transcript_8413/g.24818 Transcript_8413/m.24818 type:complete len:215 (+) Transcript_8413:530-1174(+)
MCGLTCETIVKQQPKAPSSCLSGTSDSKEPSRSVMRSSLASRWWKGRRAPSGPRSSSTTGSISPGTHAEAVTADAMSMWGVSMWLSISGGAPFPRDLSGVQVMLSVRPECPYASRKVKPRVNQARPHRNCSASYIRPCRSSRHSCRPTVSARPSLSAKGPSEPISRKRSLSSSSTRCSSSSVRQHAIAATTAPADVPLITAGSSPSLSSALRTP